MILECPLGTSLSEYHLRWRCPMCLVLGKCQIPWLTELCHSMGWWRQRAALGSGLAHSFQLQQAHHLWWSWQSHLHHAQQTMPRRPQAVSHQPAPRNKDEDHHQTIYHKSTNTQFSGIPHTSFSLLPASLLLLEIIVGWLCPSDNLLSPLVAWPAPWDVPRIA